jgi:hypothetical protein
VAVPGEGEAVVQVGFGLVVLDVSGVDLRVEEREAPRDAVLLGAEQVERARLRRSGLAAAWCARHGASSRSACRPGLVLGGGVESVELTG